MYTCGMIDSIDAFLLLRFKKPSRDKLLTNEYYRKWYDDQNADNISVHRGLDEGRGIREGSKQSSICSWFSGEKKPSSEENASLLKNENNTGYHELQNMAKP
ncbi:hypothetical protein ACJMK2_031768 [Sinanodonta woodiana]|uniref:Uncharacterized protein n=1 Tax=Sinanodonta woodiana TaxID=1069815 RepID=A0ABD3X370_SINWO